MWDYPFSQNFFSNILNNMLSSTLISIFPSRLILFYILLSLSGFYTSISPQTLLHYPISVPPPPPSLINPQLYPSRNEHERKVDKEIGPRLVPSVACLIGWILEVDTVPVLSVLFLLLEKV